MRYLVGVVAGLVVVGTVWAHGLDVVCRVEKDDVIVKATFSDGTPAQYAMVQIKNDLFAVIAQTQADERGECRLPRPDPGTYQVVVDAGAGHRKKEALVVANGDAKETVPGAGGAVPAPSGRSPWFRLGLGLATIGLASAALFFGLRWRRGGNRPA